MSRNATSSRHGWELKAIFSFGVAFVLILVIIAVTLPRPTEFQQLIFRIVLALAAAGVGALIPGFLAIRYKTFLRAGGALAVFAMVYFFNPATLVISTPPPHAILPTDPFRIIFVVDQEGNFTANSYDFPVSDIRKNASGGEFKQLLEKLPNIPSNVLADSTIFRISDENIINDGSNNVLDGGNLGVLIIPNSVVQEYDDPHLAFTHIFSQVWKRN